MRGGGDHVRYPVHGMRGKAHVVDGGGGADEIFGGEEEGDGQRMKKQDDKECKNGVSDSERQRQLRKKDPIAYNLSQAKRQRLLTIKKFNLSIDEYYELIKSQNNTCAICGFQSIGKALSIDHDHDTGSVRGLLCSSCNLALGYFYDDIYLIVNAIEYLSKYKIPKKTGMEWINEVEMAIYFEQEREPTLKELRKKYKP